MPTPQKATGHSHPVSNAQPCNTGGTGTTDNDPAADGVAQAVQKTIIDTIAWNINGADPVEAAQTCERIPSEIKSPRLRALMWHILRMFPPGCRWTAPSAGKGNYALQTKLVSGSNIFGWVGFDKLQKKQNWVYLTGTGLLARRDAGFTDDSLAELCDLPEAKITRIDIALDIFDHSTFSVEHSISAHEACKYNVARAPKTPRSKIIISDAKTEDGLKARTHYIGSDSSTKKARIYDKGLQMMGGLSKKQIEMYKNMGIIDVNFCPAGSKVEEWTRAELEYRKDNKRILTREMITNRDSFFAGGYPMFAELLLVSDGVRPANLPRQKDYKLSSAIQSGKAMTGGLIYHLREELGYSFETIVNLLIGTRSPARLRAYV